MVRLSCTLRNSPTTQPPHLTFSFKLPLELLFFIKVIVYYLVYYPLYYPNYLHF